MSCTAVVRRVGDVAIVDLGGRFTLGDGTGVIKDTVAELLRAGERNILLNLTNVAYLDSAAGIGGLVAAYTAAVKQGARLKLLRAGKYVDYALHVTGLHRVFEIQDDEAGALRSFGTIEAAAG
jgi:anti-sigma B factor antagonist